VLQQEGQAAKDMLQFIWVGGIDQGHQGGDLQQARTEHRSSEVTLKQRAAREAERYRAHEQHVTHHLLKERVEL